MEYTIKADPKEYWVSYKVYEVAGWMDDTQTTPLYGSEWSTNQEDGHVIVEGDVKWDGCSNWSFNEQVMLHGCAREDLEAVGRMLSECWDMTATLCPHWKP